MREKYESLAVAVLRDLAKSRGIEGISAMRKADLVEAMLALDEKEKNEKPAEAEEKPVEKKEEKPAEKPAEKTEKNNPEDTLSSLDSGITANGILEVMADGICVERKRFPSERGASEKKLWRLDTDFPK